MCPVFFNFFEGKLGRFSYATRYYYGNSGGKGISLLIAALLTYKGKYHIRNYALYYSCFHYPTLRQEDENPYRPRPPLRSAFTIVTILPTAPPPSPRPLASHSCITTGYDAPNPNSTPQTGHGDTGPARDSR